MIIESIKEFKRLRILKKNKRLIFFFKFKLFKSDKVDFEIDKRLMIS